MTTPTPSGDPTPTTTPPAGDPTPNPPSGGGDPAGGTPPKPDGDPGKTFTQADLDRIIADRLKTEKTRFEQQLADLQATAGKSELEAAQIKAQQAEEKVGTVTKESAARLAKTEAKLAAHLAGGKPDRLNAILSQADLTDAVSDTGEVDEGKVKTAIAKVLEDFPEWKADKVPGSSGSELNPGGESKPSFTRKQIQDMSQEERVRRVDEINEAAAAGRITS